MSSSIHHDWADTDEHHLQKGKLPIENERDALCWVKSAQQWPFITQNQLIKISRNTTLRKRGEEGLWGTVGEVKERGGGTVESGMKVQRKRVGIINCVRKLVCREITSFSWRKKGMWVSGTNLPSTPTPPKLPKVEYPVTSCLKSLPVKSV